MIVYAPIPVITATWILEAAQQRLDDLEGEARSLLLLNEHHALPTPVAELCQQMLAEVDRLRCLLAQLENGLAPHLPEQNSRA